MSDIPKKIGKYQIRSLLGSGAMGVVYLGFDPDIQRTVAIKVLHSHLQNSDRSQSAQDRFRREAQAAAKCSHPNIVSVYDLGKEAERDFIVMEYVQGEELKFFLNSGNHFSLTESLHIINLVLEGLKTAHKFKVVHRDIKPSNIILLDTGEIKIADFGIAKMETSDLTVAGNVIGTPSYMCPEGLAGHEVDHRADIYSTGMVLFEMLTGEKPTPRELYSQSVREFVDNVFQRDRGSSLSPGIKTLLRKALADDKDNRYQDASSFLDALRTEEAEISSAEPAATSLAETVINQRPLIKPQQPAVALDEGFLNKLEQGLTSYMGPMARILVRKGSTSLQTPESLIEELARHIDDPREREEFLKLARRCIKDGTCHGSQTSNTNTGTPTLAETLSPAQVEKIARVLTFYVGPLARRIVDKEASSSFSLEQLHHLLADKIPDIDEKTAFLKQVQK